MTTPNYMAQLGATLVDRGFPILPIQPRSKKPGMYRQGALALRADERRDKLR